MLDKIREICERQGINIAELERRADLTPRSVYKWEFVQPSVDKVARVARVLGVTIEELLPQQEVDQ